MKKIVKIPMLVCVITFGLLAVSCSKSETKEENIGKSNEHHHSDSDSVYACPMHPEVTGKKGDMCNKCGMYLEPVKKQDKKKIDVNIKTTPETIEAGKSAELSLSILQDGKNAELQTSHEKDVHLIVVSEDLAWFDHIHPIKQEDGSYAVEETFPHSGKYLLYTDFKLSDMASQVNRQELQVTGKSEKTQDINDEKLVSKVDGYTVSLANGADFKTGATQHIGISVEKGGKSITEKNIEPYLGAVAHIVIIGEKDKEFLHTHPESTEKYPIHGETHFEKPGKYRMWVQFQTDGKVHTADFTVNVAQGENIVSNSEESMHHH